METASGPAAAGVVGEVQGRQAVAQAGQRIGIDGADFREVERFEDGAFERFDCPFGEAVRGHGQQDALRGAGSGVVLMEGNAGDLLRRGENVHPLVDGQAGDGGARV